jgi:hypothetical protein
MKTILIPTDFSIESLNLFKVAAQSANERKTDIILFHCIDLGDSIIDLLFFSREDLINSLVKKEFKEACTIVKNRYHSAINEVKLEFFNGTTHAAFNHFLDANKITEIMIPKEYKLRDCDKRSFDPIPYILKSSLPITEVSWVPSKDRPEKDQLAELFDTGTLQVNQFQNIHPIS